MDGGGHFVHVGILVQYPAHEDVGDSDRHNIIVLVRQRPRVNETKTTFSTREGQYGALFVTRCGATG